MQGNRVLSFEHPGKIPFVKNSTKSLGFQAVLAWLLLKEIERIVSFVPHCSSLFSLSFFAFSLSSSFFIDLFGCKIGAMIEFGLFTVSLFPH